MSADDSMPAGAPKPRKRSRQVASTDVAEREPLVPVRDKLLLNDDETGALLGIQAGSVTNLESRDPDFPKPVDLALDRKLRRRTDVEAYVARLKQRRT